MFTDRGSRTALRRIAPVGAVALGVVLLASACSASAPSLTGTWTTSDGSPTKVIADNGACSGMYYNGGQVLDIGGPETCTLSSSAHNGFYDLVVQQSPNQETLQVQFHGNDAVLFSGGKQLVTLTKN